MSPGLPSLGSAALQGLNCVNSPIWAYSAASDKIVWRNQAAHSLFGGLQPPDSSHLSVRVLEEVEIRGGEVVLHGKEGQLPGVPTMPIDTSAYEFLYKPVLLHDNPGVESTRCTMIQMQPALSAAQHRLQLKDAPYPAALSGSPGSNGLRTSFNSRTMGRDLSRNSSAVRSSRALAYGVLTIPEVMDLVESLLDSRPVSESHLRALHGMLSNGDLVLQSGRIGEDLVAQEHLPTDVGLSLMLLLGSAQSNCRAPATEEGILDLGSSELATPSRANTPVSRCNIVHLTTGSSGGGACSSNETSTTLQPLQGCEDVSEAEEKSPREDGVHITSLLPAMDAVLATADEWRFDAFKLSEATAGHPLSVLGFYLLKRSGVTDTLGLDGPCLARFLRHMEDSYPCNPYHCRLHAADVLQSMHVIMARGGLMRRMGDDVPLIMLAGYLAAIVHDGEHRGLNNDYLVRTGDDLALTYNDASPMENHHVAAAFRLIRRSGLNFLRKLSKERMVRLRRLLIDMVLATDMKSHFKILSLFQAKLQTKHRSGGYHSNSGRHTSDCGGPASLLHSGGAEEPCTIEDETDRSLVLQVALKCADVGHLAAPWEVHHRWVTCLEEEFFRQGDREKAASLTVSPLMDRCKDGITKSQVGFLDIVALPLFCSFAAVFPDCSPLVRAVEDNCNKWRQIELGRSSRA